MATIKQLEGQIQELQFRNRRVEADKAWETSIARKVLIVFITYILIVIFFYSTNLPNPWINAIVPSLAFVLSTLTVPFCKKLWLRNYNKTKKK
jgi:peptidoglycan/LPS O-acetylase OafA/YrhL